MCFRSTLVAVRSSVLFIKFIYRFVEKYNHFMNVLYILYHIYYFIMIGMCHEYL